jgi:hypothetical protein
VFWLRGRRQRIQRFLKPRPELIAASVVRTHRRLRFAFRVIGWAHETDVKMFIVSPPRADFGQPRTIRPSFASHGFLDCRVHKDTGDNWILRSGADKCRAFMRPCCWIDVALIFCNHVQRHIELAFLR